MPVQSGVGARRASCCLEQKPNALLGLVDPDFKQAHRRNIAVLVATLCTWRISAANF
jgi:hypothetical protein